LDAALAMTKRQESRFAQPKGCPLGGRTGMYAMKQNKTLDPLHILHFSPDAVMFDADTIAHLIE
jgi:hypothetical protein